MQQPARLRMHPAGFVALFALIAVLVAACGAGGAGSSPTPVPVNLVGSTWRAVLIRDAPPVVGAEPTIQFDRDQAGGTTGCNSYGGAYTIGADGSFKMGPMMMTEMACNPPRGTQEGTVVEILTNANRIEIVDGMLRISGTSGSITFAEDPP